MFQLIFFSLLNGLVYGMLLFMLSSGLTLIFGMMGVLNFAHASFYMLGAYFAFTLGLHIGFWPALVIAPVLVGLLGALVERQGLRRVHGFGHIAELIFTFGVAILSGEFVQLVGGGPAKSSQVPDLLDFPLFRVMSSSFPAYKAFMLVVAVAIFGFIFVILTRTRAGLIIQASLTHPGMVAMLGHNVPRVFMVVFGIGSALGALARVNAGAGLGTLPRLAHALRSIVLVVVVLRGPRRPPPPLRPLARRRARAARPAAVDPHGHGHRHHESDGHRRRVRALLQHAARPGRHALVRPRRLLRPRRFHRRSRAEPRRPGHALDPGARAAAGRRPRRPRLRHPLRLLLHPARGHGVRADLARPGRADGRLLADLRPLLRRRGGHHHQPLEGAAAARAGIHARPAGGPPDPPLAGRLRRRDVPVLAHAGPAP